MAGKEKIRDWDDGSTVVDMDVEGMPWVGQRMRKLPPFCNADPTLTRHETRKLIINALAATLLLASVFAVAGLLFILFCLHVWLK